MNRRIKRFGRAVVERLASSGRRPSHRPAIEGEFVQTNRIVLQRISNVLGRAPPPPPPPPTPNRSERFRARSNDYAVGN